MPGTTLPVALGAHLRLASERSSVCPGALSRLPWERVSGCHRSAVQVAREHALDYPCVRSWFPRSNVSAVVWESDLGCSGAFSQLLRSTPCVTSLACDVSVVAREHAPFGREHSLGGLGAQFAIPVLPLISQRLPGSTLLVGQVYVFDCPRACAHLPRRTKLGTREHNLGCLGVHIVLPA